MAPLKAEVLMPGDFSGKKALARQTEYELIAKDAE